MISNFDLNRIVDNLTATLKANLGKPHIVYSEEHAKKVELSDRVAVHCEIGKFPEKLFITRAPNQTTQEFDYIKANHKTVSFPVWVKYLGVLNRIWADQNWSIHWPDASDSERDYIYKEIPFYGSTENFFKTLITPIKGKDANAVMVVKPYEIPVLVDDEGEPVLDADNDLQIDPTAKPITYPVIYPSIRVIKFVKDRYALVELTERSQILVGKEKKYEGRVYELYDENRIIRIVQVGKQDKPEFKSSVYWTHNLGYLPVWEMQGVPIEFEDRILWQPPFMAAVESLDLMLLDNSYLITQKAAHAYQQKWEVSNTCEHVDDQWGMCVSGYLGTGEDRHKCAGCNGTGKQRPSILGVYQVAAPDANNPSIGNVPIPPFGWVAPNPEILMFLVDELKRHLDDAESILNLKSSDSNAKGDETALGKQIDREELFSFLLSVANQTFELFVNCNKAVIEMRFGKGAKLPDVSSPKNFTLRTEQDITEEIVSAKEGGAPDSVIRNLLLEWVSIRFNDGGKVMKITEIAFAADKLATLSSSEITAKVIAKTVSAWQDTLHTFVYSYIDFFLRTDSKWFDKKIEDQVKDLENKAKEDHKLIIEESYLPDANSML